MAFAATAFIISQYEDFPNYWLKAFDPGTTIPKVMAIDPSGSPTVAKLELNSDGFPVTTGSVMVIPYIDGAYDMWLFPTEAEADANDTSNALQFADNVTGVSTTALVQVYRYELTTSTMKNSALYTTDSVGTIGVITAENVSSNGLGAIYDIVLTSGVTPNAKDIIVGVAEPLISFVARDRMNLAPNGVDIGYGVKGNSQTNVGVQIERDITAVGTSSHGFNCADYFAEDTQALNCFGADVQIGDGTQTSEILNHVNDFQTTDQIDLGSGTITLHSNFVSQPVLLSGTCSRSFGLNVIDPLGVRDTPGFGVAGFEDNGTATSNNFTGVAISAQHGTNHRSIYVIGPFTDGGSPQTTGGGECRFEAQIISTEVRTSTSQATGAIVLSGTNAGLGLTGSIWAGLEINATGATPLFRLRDGGGTTQGFMSSGSSNIRLVNALAGDIKFGLSGTDVLELRSDRFVPSVTGALFLGSAANEWDTMFAQNASVISSDENLKTEIAFENEALLDAWANVTPAWYKLKTAVAKKGSEASRIHSGYIAQQIEKSLSDAGIDGFKYGLLCKDPILETVTKTRTSQRPKMKTIETQVEKFELNETGQYVRLMTTETQEVQEVEKVEVLDENGDQVMVEGVEAMVPMMRDKPIFEDYQEEYAEEEEAGEFKLSLRYHECAVVESAYLRREIKRLIDNQP